MSYQPYDRNPSGIVFFGSSASDQVFESNSSFTWDGGNSALKIPNNGYIGSQDDFDAIQIATNGDVTFSQDISIAGNLTVNGTTTYVNTTNTTLKDPIITLGSISGNASPSDDNKDRGIQFNWHNGSAAKTGFFGYDDSTGRFTFKPDATITSEVVTAGSVGTIEANLLGNVTGNLTGNADTATALQNSRDFSIDGQITAIAESFNGTGDVVLTASLTAASITGQANLGAQPANNDYLLIYDTSATSLKKVSIADFDTGAMDSFTIVGDTGSETVNDGETITFAGNAGLDVAVTATNTVTYTIDISEYSTAAVGAGDSFLMLDSDGTTEQRSTVDQLGTYLAGDNITNTAGVLSVADSDIEAAIFTTGNFVDSTRINFTVTAGDSVTADLIANTVSETYLTASVAGDGLTGGNGSPLAVGAGSLIDVQANVVDVDLTEAAAATIAAGDYIIFLDGGATGAASKGSINDVTTLLAGQGLTTDGAELDVNVDGSTLEINTDTVRVKDGGITEAKLDRTIETATSSKTADKDITLVNATGGNVQITLPENGGTGWSGDGTRSRIMVVKRIDGGSNTVTIAAAGSDSIDTDFTSVQLYHKNETMTFASNGADWFII